MRNVDPSLRLGWLVQDMDDAILARAKALGLFQLCPKADKITQTLVQQARAVVTEVRAWGLNSDSVSSQAKEVQTLIHNLLAAGCDGMTINWPDWVRHEE